MSRLTAGEHERLIAGKPASYRALPFDERCRHHAAPGVVSRKFLYRAGGSTLDSGPFTATIPADHGAGRTIMGNPFGLAKYGLGTLAGITVILILAGAALWINVHPWTIALPVVFFLFSLYFFRDPDRRLPEGEDLVLSPADGKVVDIEDMEEVDAPDFMAAPDSTTGPGPDGETGKVTRVGIFLSVFSCHVNRAPVAGVVRKTEYRRGRFLAAFNEKAAAENESNFIGIETDRRLPSGEALKVAVKQISGVIARRIVSVAREGDSLSRGERFGMIKFGSRTELYLPAESVAELSVEVGDKVRGGSSVIGRLRAAGPGEPEDA